ncbi:hypothetical protein Pedsa_3622 [Pseudopedobacter saltans DSM 12145]|uniref:Poly(Beta-D-mannuronate) lyase n=1 Tax=Pseudopedobacter saltans (strain ATCC 51119 / DSM 12145 / JCM 21818 / CCUG 39354 / LMG 10337 / NBRC 100064 / NCIMB 13643) TaxID=762903 RepID=F0S4X7_PSESL|nr:polysaccharide lyase 6 family protein [Pseudopedobacter saltans]ADY54151.1 hypothetical protein Pedsa_3622 [Pseudopedobacter saltans DSM 12145]
MNIKKYLSGSLLIITFLIPIIVFSACKKNTSAKEEPVIKYAEKIEIRVSNEMPRIGESVSFIPIYSDKADRIVWSVDNINVPANTEGAIEYVFKDEKEHVFKVTCSAGSNTFSSTKKIKASLDNVLVNKDLIPAGGNLIFCSNWESFASAVAVAKAGDVIQLKNGTYTGSLTIANSGAEAKPIVIVPETRGGVILQGDSKWNINGKYITVDGFYFSKGTSTHPISFGQSSSFCRFINSAIVGWNLGGGDTRLVTIRGTKNEVGNCVLRQKNTAGMMLEVVRETSARNDHLIHHVYFGYFKDPGSGNGFETVRISTSGQSLSSSYTTLENCVFERCDGEAEIVSSKCGHNTYRNNTFLNSDGALTLRHGHDCLVEGNFFINTKGTPSSRCNGIRVIGERHTVRNNYFYNLPSGAQAIQVEYGNEVPHDLNQYDQVKDALIEYNTVYNCDKGIRLGASRNTGQTPPKTLPPGGVFKNNLIVSSAGSGNSMEIEGEIITGNLFSYTDNVVAGKNKIVPAILPSGLQYITSVAMKADGTGIYRPTDSNIKSGVQQTANFKPLNIVDIVPEWVKLKIDSGDREFSGEPW